MRKRWLDRIYQEADKVFEAQLDLALGYYREADSSNGPIRLYERPPNGKAIQWILEQIWGKAEEIKPAETEAKTMESEISPKDQELMSKALSFVTEMSESITK